MVSPRIRDHQVSGNIVEDPQKVATPQGRNLVTFKLAENTRVRDRETNQWVDGEAIYYDVAIDADYKALGNLAENVADSLKKGQSVKVDGDLTNNAYLDRDGNPQVGNRIWASDVSPSMRFATVDIQPNQMANRAPVAEAHQGAQAQQRQGVQEQTGQRPPLADYKPDHQQAAQDQMMQQHQDFGVAMH